MIVIQKRALGIFYSIKRPLLEGVHFGTSIVSSALINPGNTVTSTNLFIDLIYSSFTAPIKLNILNVFFGLALSLRKKGLINLHTQIPF